MRDVFLCITMIAAFAYGLFVIKRLDSFIDENKKRTEAENDTAEPSRIMLTGDLSDAEICEEIDKFRSRHEGMYIVLYDSAREISDETDDSGRKR